VQVGSPVTVNGSWQEAKARAEKESEPVFLPVKPYADDRGWSFMNLLTGVCSSEGQVNVSTQYPGVIKAWHRHHRQMDVWTCIRGHLKAGVYREDDAAAWAIVLGEMRPGALFIPPTLWHGAATVGDQAAGLLYYVTQAYDPNQPDEERRPFDAFQGFPWEVRHR